MVVQVWFENHSIHAVDWPPHSGTDACRLKEVRWDEQREEK